MKITKLKIQGYKNIQDLTIDFTDGLNYAAFVGLNGSGKSNIIEAVSLFFRHVYSGSWRNGIGFFFEATIVNNNSEIILTKNGRGLGVVGENAMDNIPSNIITCYSGEETRLYDSIYKHSYQSYFDLLKKDGEFAPPRMIYIDKSCWILAIIALLVSDKLESEIFVKKVFKGLNLNDIYITFDVHISKSTKQNIVSDFVKRVFSSLDSDNRLYIKTLLSLDLGEGYLNTHVKDLFYYFFTAIVTKPIDHADELITDLQLHGIDVKSLSEGEKKQILITFINEILADENSLVLLDEPDAHWHIERQKELAKTIKQQNNFTILTTHSPTFAYFLGNDSIYMLNNSKNGTQLVNMQNKCVINELSNGELSIQEQNILLVSNKHILLVEGKTDAKYIQTAIEKLSSDLEFEYIPVGGASGLELFLDKFTPQPNQKIIALVDCDESGIKSQKVVLKKYNVDKYEEPTLLKENTYLLMLPKPNGKDLGNDSQYEIEDYFPLDDMRSIVIDRLKNDCKLIKNFNIKKDTVKEHLAKKIDGFSADKFNHFSSLLTVLKSTVDLDVSNLLSATQLNIFADYVPRGQDKVHYDAIFDRIDKSVTYNGNKYVSADKAMRAIRESVGIKTGQRAGFFWKYLNQETNQVENIQALLNK
jgi:predicted ATP-dependent endonuclease of OLD family